MNKQESVLLVLKKHPGKSFTARELGKMINLTSGEAGHYLSKLANEGAVEQISINKRTVMNLWKYPLPYNMGDVA